MKDDSSKYSDIAGKWFKKIKEVYYVIDDSNVIDSVKRSGEWMWIATVFRDLMVRFHHLKRPPGNKNDFLWVLSMGEDYVATEAEECAVIKAIFEEDLSL